MTGIKVPGAIDCVQVKVSGGFQHSPPCSPAGTPGIKLFVLIGCQPLSMGSIAEHVPWLDQLMPWGLVSESDKTEPRAAYLVMGQP